MADAIARATHKDNDAGYWETKGEHIQEYIERNGNHGTDNEGADLGNLSTNKFKLR